MKVDEFLEARQNRREYEEELNEVEELVSKYEEPEEEEEERPRRKVVGRMPRRANYNPDMKPPREMIDTAVPVEYYQPPPQNPTIIYAGGQNPNNPAFRQMPPPQPTQKEIQRQMKAQAQADIQYQKVLQAELYREQMRNRPRISGAQKCLNTANRFAMGDEGRGAVIKMDTGLIKPLRAVPLSINDNTNGMISLNNTIKKVSPRVSNQKLAPVKAQSILPPVFSKKKKGLGFF